MAFAALMLGGCQTPLTLEEAIERCTQQGGLLTIIYTQQITASGVGEQIGSPGDCVQPSKFEAANPAPTPK
jgi:hypothetical protein